MSDIKIVEYSKKYAESLAKMWNESGDNWGGENLVRTAEDIDEMEELSGNIKTFLAIIGEEVIGYCGFSEYRHDEGATYIPLLNVRPDYLGKKIGKKLVLACVDEAIKAPETRLDLYTWQGNDKAVPLYKKCGFFWEKRDDSTHLMNFIPYVMGTEAVAKYFEVIDWYSDSVRELKVECDGVTEGEFDYYEYKWKKDTLSLSMEFERRGRGLSGIETDDYSIKCRVAKQNLVFGMNYDIEYEIVNKTGKPLDITIEGVRDKNIEYNADIQKKVLNKTTIIDNFYVGSISDAQEKWKTHPTVTSKVTINGKKAEFKIGINPKLPVEVEIGNRNIPVQLGSNIMYLDMENGFDEQITLTGRLHDTPYVKFDEEIFCVDIKPREKVSLPLPYQLLKHCFYSEKVSLDIQINDKKIDYKSKVRGALRGYNGDFYGEDKSDYYLINGPYTLKVIKKNNIAYLSHIDGSMEQGMTLMPPQLGKPFYDELSNKKPTSYEFIRERECLSLKMTFELDKKHGLLLIYWVKLQNNGMVKASHEIVNTTDNSCSNLHISQRVYHYLQNSYLPMDNKVVYSLLGDGAEAQNWNSQSVDECWAFSGESKHKAITWHEDMTLKLNHVFFELESKIGKLNANSRYQTKEIMVCVDVFSKWQEVRNYLNLRTYKECREGFEIAVNKRNPFMDNEDIVINFEEEKKIKIQGGYELYSTALKKELATKPLVFVDNKASDNQKLEDVKHDILKITFNSKERTITRYKPIFIKTKAPVMEQRFFETEKEVYQLSNEYITIKASPAYGPGIYSLNVEGDEWLDHSFPEHSIKAWWNYWTGGMYTAPDVLSNVSIFEEDKQAEFVKLKDNKGNQWTGIKTSLNILKHEELKGVTVEDYFMLLPGVPVMCHFVIVQQKMNKYMNKEEFIKFSFIKQGKSINDNYITVNHLGNEEKYQCSESGYELELKGVCTHGSADKVTTMTRILDNSCFHEIANTNGVVMALDLKNLVMANNERVVFDRSYCIFSDDTLTDEMLGDFRNILFEV